MLRRPLLASNHEGDEEKSWFAKSVNRLARRSPFPLLIGLFIVLLFIGSFVIMIFKQERSKFTLLVNDISPLSDVIYTDLDSPFFNESVPEYRQRLQRQLNEIQPGTIFVSVASFRDTKCQKALRQLFDRAQNPNRIFVGVVDQTKLDDSSDDVPCDALLNPSERARVRLVRLPSSRARGPTHARYIASKLWDREEIFMQVDAHSWFAPNWDTLLFDNLNALPDPYHSAITHYPPGNEAELGLPDVTWVCEAKVHEQAPPGLFVQGQDICRQQNKSPGIALRLNGDRTTCVSPFMGGGFFAARSNFLYDAPYDRYLPYIFHGEEVLIAARLWTSGWNLYTPMVNIVAHNYTPRVKNVHVETPTWGPIGKQSEARARFLLQSPLDTDVDFDRSELEHLGMGMKRPLKEYLEFAGIGQMSRGIFQSRCKQRWQNNQWVNDDSPQELDSVARLPIFAENH